MSSQPHATLRYRDPSGRDRIRPLTPPSITVGRDTAADLVVSWDEQVSRLHARLELVGEDPAADWTVVDDPPSRNGSYVNGVRVRGRTRLQDGDVLSVGATALTFRAPSSAEDDAAALATL